MGDNYTEDGDALEGYNGRFSVMLPINGAAAAENVKYSVHQIDPTGENGENKSQVHGFLSEDGARDDMFVDCNDEIETSSNQNDEDNLQIVQDGESRSEVKQQDLIYDVELLHDTHDKGSEDKEKEMGEYEEERNVVMSELAHLYYQVKTCNEEHTKPYEYDGHLEISPVTQISSKLGSDVSLIEMVNECSRFFINSSRERLQNEERVKELHLMLDTKDQEINSLNAKLADFSQLNSQLSESSLESDHIEDIANKMLASLSMVFPHEGMEGTLTEKIASMEKSTAFLVEKYLAFASETEQLRRCLFEVGLNSSMMHEMETFPIACKFILESSTKEENLHASICNLQDDRSKIVHELDKHKSLLENLYGEIQRINTEVEHEKSRCANTKEKLSMAVTKGKTLIQQRDSLKQMLAEKADELEKCSIELQDKATALEDAEKTKELLGAIEKSSASMQDLIAEKDLILQNCREVLLEGTISEDLPLEQMSDKIRLLALENRHLRTEYHKLADSLSSLEFPESVDSSELDNRVHWLVESLYYSKEEALRLHSEAAKTKESVDLEISKLTVWFVAQNLEIYCLEEEGNKLREECETNERRGHEIVDAREALSIEIDQLKSSHSADSQEKSNLLLGLDNMRQEYEGVIEKERQHHSEEANHLKDLLSAESLEKSCLLLEFENLRQQYEGVVEKERLIALDKDKLLSWLLEESGLVDYGQNETCPEPSEMKTIFDNCLTKIKENNELSRPSHYDETFEVLQSLIYVAYQGMSLYELVVEEEDILAREKMDRLSDELEKKTIELNSLVDEKAAMQKNVSHLEDRCAILKDKLSMAVKKGKGLAHEKENFKNILNGKNIEIENFRSELQQNIIQYNESLDQITKLTNEVELIPVLQKDLVSAKEHEDQLEHFLSESKSALEGVLESIESITIPNNLVFEEPVEKLRWISRYVNENEISKMEAEEELRKVKHEASLLAGKLSSTQAIIKSLEDALFVAEYNQSVLLNEKEKLELSMAGLEKELHEERVRSESHLSKLESVYLSTRALENDLSQARVNIFQLINDRDAAVESRNLAEEKLLKLEDEFSQHIIRISDAGKTIESLENALSQAQMNITILAEKNSGLALGKADLRREIDKLKIEAESNLSKISESSSTIRMLEAFVVDAENKIAELVQEKTIHEQEISSLSSKLESCNEELARTCGSMQNNSTEFSVLSQYQLILKDKTLQSFAAQYFESHIENMKAVDSLFKDIGDCFPEIDSDFQSSFSLEDYLPISTTYPSSPISSWNMDSFEDEIDVADDGNILFHIEKVSDRFLQKRNFLADKIGSFSAYVDESYASLLKRLHGTRDRIKSLVNYTKVLKQNIKDVNTDKQNQEEITALTDRDNRILSSACTDANEKLTLNLSNSVSELRSLSELIEHEGNVSLFFGAIGHQSLASFGTNNVDTAEKLSNAVRCNCDLIQLLKDALHKMTEMTRDLQKRMEENQHTFHEASKERELYKNQVLTLEGDLEAQQSLHSSQIDDYKEKMNEIMKREVDLSTSLSKFHEMHNPLLPASQLKAILDKMNGVIVPTEYVNSGGDAYDSIDVRKLCYIVDSFNDYLHKANSLSRENKELKSIVDQQFPEIESLRKQVEAQAKNKVDTEDMNKLIEIESGLMRLVQKLGGNDLMDEENIYGPVQLVSMLDQLVMDMTLKSEMLRSKHEELVAKLYNTPKDFDDSSNKVRLHENSNLVRHSLPEIQQERGNLAASLPPESEISELQGMGTVPKINSNPLVPSAAHARTMRKGSSDHLAINVDSVSQQLIHDKDSDKDKGHIFKSLNTSGMIPRQGRVVADRIDGIWVSGSRALMNHPSGRLGFIAYTLLVHLWLLGTIL